MTIVNGYTTAAVLKARLDVQGTDKDTVIEQIIGGVSRSIDNYCNRVFFKSALAEKRYFSPVEPHILFVDDLQAITTLKTDDNGDGTFETTWAATDYKLMPLNRTADITPALWVNVASSGNYGFPIGIGTVEIDATWGYCTLANVPEPVREACIIQSNRIYMRQHAPFGVVGSADMGTLMAIAKLDPDVEMLLAPYRRN